MAAPFPNQGVSSSSSSNDNTSTPSSNNLLQDFVFSLQQQRQGLLNEAAVSAGANRGTTAASSAYVSSGHMLPGTNPFSSPNQEFQAAQMGQIQLQPQSLFMKNPYAAFTEGQQQHVPPGQHQQPLFPQQQQLQQLAGQHQLFAPPFLNHLATSASVTNWTTQLSNKASASPAESITSDSHKRPLDMGEKSASCTGPAQKKRTPSTKDSMLHNACRLFPKAPAVVGSALQFDAASVRRPIPTACGPSSWLLRFSQQQAKTVNSTSKAPSGASSVASGASGNSNMSGGDHQKSQHHHEGTPELYRYPINIAMMHGASQAVIDLLSTAGPDVLMLPDGPDEVGSMAIYLELATKKRGCTAVDQSNTEQVVKFLINANKHCALVCDRHQNTPLHYALRAPHVSLQTVKILYEANPAALMQSNFHGQTPLDVATRCSAISEQILDYLQSMSYKDIEGDSVRHLDLAADPPI